ncbi:MAG: septum site-determining protein MinD [Chloroflexi bacterium]|nr:MAG: septum site-determining protein MinD [Chloroflexota bacterium]
MEGRGSDSRRRAARVITITSGKGGVGKTTLVANLSVALAMQGQRVVAIDADVGLRNLDMMLGLENRVVYDLVDVIEERCRLRQALVRDKRLSELFLLPAAQTRDKSAVQPADMIRVCEELREQHDFILVDSPAGIEQGFRYAIAPAEEVLIVTNPEVAAVRDADRVIGLVEAEEKGPARLIVNRVRPDLVRRGEMLDISDVVELLAIDLVGIVPEDEAILVTTNRGQPLAFSSDSSQAGRAFHNIAQRLLGQDVPFITLREPGVFERIFRFMRSEGDGS